MSRFLPAPTGLSEQATDMPEMVGDAELLLYHLSYTRARPDIAAETKGFGPALEQSRQLGFLLFTQACTATRWGALGQVLGGGGTGLSSTFEPVADRALADAEGFGDPALLPAAFIQCEGAQAPIFA